jgi:hypothetical protein
MRLWSIHDRRWLHQFQRGEGQCIRGGQRGQIECLLKSAWKSDGQLGRKSTNHWQWAYQRSCMNREEVSEHDLRINRVHTQVLGSSVVDEPGNQVVLGSIATNVRSLIDTNQG